MKYINIQICITFATHMRYNKVDIYLKFKYRLNINEIWNKCSYGSNVYKLSLFTKNLFLMGFTAITTSLFISKLQVMHTSIIFSMGMNEAGPNGLNISDQISTGHTGLMKKSVLALCS